MKPVMTFCQKSIQHFKNIIHTHSAKTIMIGVKGGGCNGLKYTIDPIDNLDRVHPLDESILVDDISIHVCHKSLMFLLGTHVSWEETIMNQGIQFNNPNITNTCGCGETFSID